MSEDSLAKYIDQRMANGETAPDPEDPETRELKGTIQLTQASLGGPKPSEDAERQSRERIVNMIQNGPLSIAPHTNGLTALWRRFTIFLRRRK